MWVFRTMFLLKYPKWLTEILTKFATILKTIKNIMNSSKSSSSNEKINGEWHNVNIVELNVF